MEASMKHVLTFGRRNIESCPKHQTDPKMPVLRTRFAPEGLIVGLQSISRKCELIYFPQQLVSWRVLEDLSSGPMVLWPRRSVARAVVLPQLSSRAASLWSDGPGGRWPELLSSQLFSQLSSRAASLWTAGPGGRWPELLSSQLSSQ